MSDASEKKPTVSKGLKGVQAADSSICLVNGAEGRLLYRGYNIDALAQGSSFEDVAYLLLRGELPNREQSGGFVRELTAHRNLPTAVVEFLRQAPATAHPMAVLRSAVSIAGLHDAESEDDSLDSAFRKSIRLTAMLATIVASQHRLRQGLEPVEANSSLGHAANFLYMINGTEPSEDAAKAMDLILILHAEHGFNASTFAGRVIVATLTDIYSAVTGAIGALKGKLHGGANTEVLRTLIQVGSVENVAGWVDEVRARKGKFMGFGHAVYQTADPRAKHLKELSRRLGEEAGNTLWYDISVEMEKRVVASIQRECNVDFYSAGLQHYMGIPGELFTCIFAASRIAGWCAHILEQLADNKIIRPKANYIGYEERGFVPLETR
ncbi:MAG: citrate synthase [Planctomycetaceae bacterium]|nr:citrate synthase [Planctomycetaceae bacterium]